MIEAAYLYLKKHPQGRPLIVSEEIIAIDTILASYPELKGIITPDESFVQTTLFDASGLESTKRNDKVKIGGLLLLFAYILPVNCLWVIWHGLVYAFRAGMCTTNYHYKHLLLLDARLLKVLFVCMFVSSILFYAKKRIAPAFISVTLLIQAVAIPLDILVVGDLRLLKDLDGGTMLEMAKYGIWAIGWISYFLMSKRSRETFVN